MDFAYNANSRAASRSYSITNLLAAAIINALGVWALVLYLAQSYAYYSNLVCYG